MLISLHDAIFYNRNIELALIMANKLFWIDKTVMHSDSVAKHFYGSTDETFMLNCYFLWSWSLHWRAQAYDKPFVKT